MNIIRKLNSIFSFSEKKVDGAEIWVVSWTAYSSGIFADYPFRTQKYKAFLNEEEAIKFKDNLKQCLKILQFDLSIGISIEKQK